MLAYTNRNPVNAGSYYIDQICDHWWNVNFTDRDVGDLRIFHLHCNWSSETWWYRNQPENGENAKWAVANGHWYLYSSVHHPTVFLLHGSAQSKNERLEISTIYDNENPFQTFVDVHFHPLFVLNPVVIDLYPWNNDVLNYKEYPDIILLKKQHIPNGKATDVQSLHKKNAKKFIVILMDTQSLQHKMHQ